MRVPETTPGSRGTGALLARNHPWCTLALPLCVAPWLAQALQPCRFPPVPAPGICLPRLNGRGCSKTTKVPLPAAKPSPALPAPATSAVPLASYHAPAPNAPSIRLAVCLGIQALPPLPTPESTQREPAALPPLPRNSPGTPVHTPARSPPSSNAAHHLSACSVAPRSFRSRRSSPP